MQFKKILLTGVNGQVGHALLSKLADVSVIALSRADLDLSNQDAIRRVIRETKPDLIINPAAYTDVDKAESEPELTYAINQLAPKVMAEEAAKLNSVIIHFSTDYVYDGTKKTPYFETDLTNPISVYSKSKLAGEDAIRRVGVPHLILRSSWIYGAYGKNFLKTILRLAGERDSLRIVADQLGAPTSSKSIADVIIDLVDKWQPQLESQTGVYHLSNAGSTSWYGFSCEIVNEYNALRDARGWPVLKTSIENIAAITTSEYATPATRPLNSRMDNSKLKKVFDIELPSWQDSLNQVMQELKL
jgi:dTDP-4-dehydrorhamnose reductase